MKSFKTNKIWILCSLFLLICVLVCGITLSTKEVNTPLKKYCVVIDAGHGGIDGGVVGYSGKTNERDINLIITKKLGSLFNAMGFKVVYTRVNENGLYDSNATNKKADDMKKRIQIINNANADLVISIHQNGYTLPSQRGITAFYKSGQDASKNLADTLQNRFKENIEYARSEALMGDYYILNECKSMCVLVECGFLTNPEEEILLQDEKYQQEICFEIFSGCIQYLVSKGDICIKN